MRERRFTSADYVQSSQGEPDAVMDSADLARIYQLAGIPGAGIAEDKNTAGQMSPVGSNISDTASELHKLEKQHHIKPGTPEWFQLWFSKPYLTGEKPVGKTAPTGNTLFSKPGTGSN